MNDCVELLQQLIRNECVNLNTLDSGNELRSVATLQQFFDGSGLDVQTYEPAPDRGSLVARIEGSDPAAPSLLLLGHLDVVPANETKWQRDPFGGELVDGWVWGRGAIDMLNMTSSMAVALKQLAQQGFRPRGDLVFAAVADEESGGELGSGWLTEHEPEAVVCDYVISEWGGVPVHAQNGTKLYITVGQKGGTDVHLTVHGTSSHAREPYAADNALVKAAKLVQRFDELDIVPDIQDFWRRHVEHMGYDAALTAALLDPQRIDDALSQLPLGLARRAHACTRTTAVPTVMHGGTKSNVIPDRVDMNVLIRRLPGYTRDDVLQLVDSVIGDLHDSVDVDVRMDVEPSQSPMDTPLWHTLTRVTKRLKPAASCIPAVTPGGNDLGYFRHKGSTAYGFGLLSDKIDIELFLDIFHGNDERVDVASLELSTRLWQEIAFDLQGNT